MDQTAISCPTATLNELTGAQIKEPMEGFVDPCYRQDGDRLSVGGLTSTLDITQTQDFRLEMTFLRCYMG